MPYFIKGKLLRRDQNVAQPREKTFSPAQGAINNPEFATAPTWTDTIAQQLGIPASGVARLNIMEGSPENTERDVL